ncbi:hypothetical protein CXG81DRAFT_29354 [Caulochytrium protostelioides]|uniref:Dihydropteridine reductase n=1 Tax=Caulochytrium protostelioides TaxID=1555241 RepID=A0A4P9XCL2_9FUNG|nr:hypothetical protein CXG81DRAFT_29354 [Caulochytrium protostelioides]|eukprot:RKP03197.1 hypothetical protein CXG81DRAFT_29354 [Caulochytrium protostelioides]
MATTKPAAALVYGGTGALGRALVSAFKRVHYHVVSVDFATNSEANANILVERGASTQQTFAQIQTMLTPKDATAPMRFRAIVNAAGGWAGGSAKSGALLSTADAMWQQSVASSLVTAHLASTRGACLDDGGLLVLVGAAAATQPTPGMIGYGLAKAGVHHLVKSLAADGSGLPPAAIVAGILPVTLDTPMNREGMPTADFASWTPPSAVADQVVRWAADPHTCESGALYKVETAAGATRFEPVTQLYA